MSTSAEELLSIARNYWRPDREFDGTLENSPEWERFQRLWEQELKKMNQWEAFLRELRVALPQFRIGNITATCDPCFRCYAYPELEDEPPSRHRALVGCVSILAPVYTIYVFQYDRQDKERPQAIDRIFNTPGKRRGRSQAWRLRPLSSRLDIPWLGLLRGTRWERINERVFFDPLPSEMQAPAEVLARRLEATFGVEALPREIAETRIPLIVDRKEPPDTTLFHALFSSEPENLPL